MKTFFLGVLLALVELIPGISAASIALIFNIYERIIKIFTQITWRNAFLAAHLLSLHKKKSRRIIALLIHKFDLRFLSLLLLGQLVAFLFFPTLLNFLLDNYKVYLLALFSVFIIFAFKKTYESYETKISFSFSWVFVGCVSFFLLTDMISAFNKVEIHSYQYFFLGLLIVCFMMLPGISGSLVLLLLGQYDIIIRLLSNLSKGHFVELNILLFFGCGLVCGAILFARIINYFLVYFSQQVLNILLPWVCFSFLNLLITQIDKKELVIFFLVFLSVFYVVFKYFKINIKNYNE